MNIIKEHNAGICNIRQVLAEIFRKTNDKVNLLNKVNFIK